MTYKLGSCGSILDTEKVIQSFDPATASRLKTKPLDIEPRRKIKIANINREMRKLPEHRFPYARRTRVIIEMTIAAPYRVASQEVSYALHDFTSGRPRIGLCLDELGSEQLGDGIFWIQLGWQ